MTKQPKKKPARVMEIKASNLSFDDRYQRDLIRSRVKKLSEEMDLDKLGVITVSKRDDDEYVVVDGQHRAHALLELGFGDWLMKCNVYQDLTLEEEAELFRALNDTRRISAFDDFKAGLVEGDPECIAILGICRKAGLDVQKGHVDGGICCVSALRKVYRNDNSRPGGEILAETLETAISAWGHKASAVEGKIVEGLGLMLGVYGDELDRVALVKKLAKLPGGGPGLISKAKVIREMEGGTIGRNVARAVRGLYNKGRRVGALPPL